MNADLTFNSIAFKKSYDSKSDGSLRRSTTRAINTPDDMLVKNQGYTDASTKVPGTRYDLRFDRTDINADGDKYISSAYVVIAVPEKAQSSDVTTLVATLKAAVADANLITNVLNSEL